MLFHAFGAAIRAGYAKIRGFRVLATQEEQSERLGECQKCEFLSEDGQCEVCLCIVEAKTMLCTETCPKKRWRAIFMKKVALKSTKNAHY